MTSDPFAARIRQRRLARGLSFRKLAALAGLASPAFVFHIENGTKLPSEATAARLAAALGDDEDLFRAWARCRGRGDLETVLEAAAVLRGSGGGSPSAADSAARIHVADVDQAPGLAAAREIAPPTSQDVPFAWGNAPSGSESARDRARLRVPVLDSGLDPGNDLHPRCAVLGHLRIDVSDLPDPTTWVRPIAYRIAERDHRRVPELEAGGIALVTRAITPPRPAEVCAVRNRGAVMLTRVLWNGRALVLLPAPDQHDFEVLATPVRETLRELLVGVVVRVLPATRAAASAVRGDSAASGAGPR